MTALAPAPRPLGGIERMMWKLDLGAPLNFTTTARVTGPLTAAHVEAALPAVQARHPQLRARIVADAQGMPAFEYSGGALPLRVAEGPWVRALEAELNTPVLADREPLGRFTFVPGGGSEAWLLATLHHSVGDGMSGAFLMRDWVNAAAQAAQGKVPSLPALADAGPVGARMPASARGVRAWATQARALGYDLLTTLKHGRPLAVRRDQPAAAWEQKVRVSQRVVDVPTTQRLAARAREEKTTVHGALSAAMLHALLADSGKAKASVAFGSPVNVRDRLTPPVGEELGCYVSMAAYRGVVRTDTPFWDLARSVRRGLEADQARGTSLALLNAMPGLFDLMGGRRRTSREVIVQRERKVPTTSGLTNLGKLALQAEHGPLRIEDCHFAVAATALGDWVGTATSLHGRVFWNFSWSEPLLTFAHAEALVSDMEARLRAAI